MAKTEKVKIPSLFKKKYTKAALNKKVYKRLFIADDKKFVQGFIEQVGTKGKKEVPLYAIPADAKISKKDQKRLMSIAKSVKKQKGSIKLLPLFAVIIFIVGVGALITLTKNMICRKAITNTCESIFEAKCDIGYLNLKFTDSSLTIKNFEVANKKEPMKDLFSIDSLIIDFDFPQLLRRHFVVEDFSVLGIETGKERKVSGDLTAKKLAKLEKKKAKKAAKEAKKTESTPVMESLKEKLLAPITADVTELFTQYNPQNIIETCYAQLETPKISEDVKVQVAKINETWKETPASLNNKYESVKSSVTTAVNYDFAAIQNDPVKIKEAIEVINAAIKDVNTLKDETQKVVNNFQTTTETVTTLSNNINKAIKHDKDLATAEINKITSFKLSDSKKLISGYFDKLGYSLMGKYYPYVYKGVNKLLEIKASSAASGKPAKAKKDKTKVVAGARLSGRDVYFRGDTTPRFWIKKMSGSGMGISAQAINISSDMDSLGKPAQADFTMKKDGIDHKAKLVVDTRSTSSAPLINADYSCTSLPIVIPASFFGEGKGIPSFDTNSKISFNAQIYDTEGFTISGNGDFRNLKITAEPFEPTFAYTIYSNVLAGIRSMNLGVTAGYTESAGLIMDIKTDADKKFAQALTTEMNNQLTKVKADAEAKLTEKIRELSGGALGEINSFEDIKNKINNASKSVDELKAQLEAKSKAAQDALKKQATDAVNAKVNEVTTQAKENATNALKGLLKK